MPAIKFSILIVFIVSALRFKLYNKIFLRLLHIPAISTGRSRFSTVVFLRKKLVFYTSSLNTRIFTTVGHILQNCPICCSFSVTGSCSHKIKINCNINQNMHQRCTCRKFVEFFRRKF